MTKKVGIDSVDSIGGLATVEAMKDPTKVFISHTDKHKAAANFAIMLNECLKRDGVHTFFDADIQKTNDYSEIILQNVRSCGLFVAILSKEYFTRQWCLRELILAIEWKIKVLPVFYEEIEEGIDDKLLRDAKLKQGFRKPPKSKAEVIGLLHEVLHEVKDRLGYTIPLEKEVTISLDRDDVYDPSQKGWIVGAGSFLEDIYECRSASGDGDRCGWFQRKKSDAAYEPQNQFATIQKQKPDTPSMKFKIRRSPRIMEGEDCYGYAIDVDDGTTRTLVASVETVVQQSGDAVSNCEAPVVRDMYTQYVFLRNRKPGEFQWRIEPKGNRCFHIMFHSVEVGKFNHCQLLNSERLELKLQSGIRVQHEASMGLAAHRYWKTDLDGLGKMDERNANQDEKATRLMITFEGKYRDFWKIEEASKTSSQGNSIVDAILCMAEFSDLSPDHFDTLKVELEKMKARKTNNKSTPH